MHSYRAGLPALLNFLLDIRAVRRNIACALAVYINDDVPNISYSRLAMSF